MAEIPLTYHKLQGTRAVPVLCTVLGDFEVVGATYLFEASARQSGKKSAE